MRNGKTGWIGPVLACILLLGAAKTTQVHAAAKVPGKPQVMIRARVLKLDPQQPVRFLWRWGGEGLGGDPVRGEFTRELPGGPKPTHGPAVGGLVEGDLPEEFKEKPKDRIIVHDETWDYTYLKPRVWSDPRPLSEFKRTRGRLFVTVMMMGHKTQYRIKDSRAEFELSYRGRVLKTFTVDGPDGPSFGIVIPFYQLDEDGRPSEAFVQEAGSLRHYAEGKAAALRAEPWASRPVPGLYGFITDCAGYRPGTGYGCRTTDRETMLAEYKVLRVMGLNGLRNAPPFVREMIKAREGIPAELSRVRFDHLLGYPIPTVKRADGRPPMRSPGDGCPYLPENVEGIKKRVQEKVGAWMTECRKLPLHSVYGLTVDEIGTVFDGAPEGKAHMGACPHCREAFREMIRADGLRPEDFGAEDWEPIRATYGYWSLTFWESKRILEERVKKAEKAAENKTWNKMGTGETVKEQGLGDAKRELEKLANKEAVDPAKELIAARERLNHLIWHSSVLEVPEEERKLKVSERGWNLLHYYSRRFNCISAAGLFEPLKDACAAENEKKRQAIARGEDSAIARQPWVYSYALRGNNFLMGGHSLDFFNFYRYADNAMIYETSNRDGRIWQWDSYLCDVGRTLQLHMGKEFAVYVKPHRGAPMQRALSAIARGARVVYWYTYGPDWAKGDTFGGRIDTLKVIGRTARIVAEAEDVTWESDWAVAPEVAIVRPRTSEFFSGSASWENGKWVYTALMHAHIPVDALDEGLLLTEDLSRYRVIAICGSHVRRDVAEKLAKWVEQGGALWTDGWGMAEDQAREPLELLLPVLGLKKRGELQQWGAVPRYGATRLRAVRPMGETQPDVTVRAEKLVSGSYKPVVGREVLQPAEGTEVLARYSDGGAAMTRHRYGKGTAYVVGTYAGVEYAWETMQRKPFDGNKRTWIAAPVREAGVRPVVDAAEPLVEGVMLRSRKDGRLAVVLINWKFKVEEPMALTIRGAGPIKSVRSIALNKKLPVRMEGDFARLTLPGMDEGDILLLE